MLVARHGVNFLFRISEAHGEDLAPVPQARQRPIIIAAPLPQPITAAIEPQQRNEKPIRLEDRFVGKRFAKAQRPCAKRIAGDKASKQKRLAFRDDAGKAKKMTLREQRLLKKNRIHLAPAGDIGAEGTRRKGGKTGKEDVAERRPAPRRFQGRRLSPRPKLPAERFFMRRKACFY